MIINKFNDGYEFLSNFFPASVLADDGLIYKNSEAAFQAHKTMDMNERARFQELTPGDAKRLGRKIELINNWDGIKYMIMFDIVSRKFQQHPDLAEKLLETEDAELIEGNVWNDTYWGVCNGVGENNLGKILMDIRESLK